MKITASERAFTMVELAIVLVIIGLLVGGVVSGKSLIAAGQVRATVSQLNEISTAVNNFRSQYGGLPGDIPNATSFFNGTTNGNGDGNVTATTVCPSGEAQMDPDCGKFDGERPASFQQLSLAGLLLKKYDGGTTLATSYPAVKLHPSQGMMITGPWMTAAASNMSAETYTTDRTYLYVGICNVSVFPDAGGTSAFNNCGIFTPSEANQIDTKLDDGLPLSGKVIGESSATTCVNGTNYNLTGADQACNLMISLVP